MKLILQVIKALFRKIEASRTHWEEVEEVEILAETTVTISEDNSDAVLTKTTQLTVGQTYFVILDGVSYECVAWYSDDEDAVIIGNGAIFGGEGGNGEPFSCDSYSGGEIYLNTEKAGTYTISISTMENVVHRLDKKYLPDEVIKSIGIANNAQTTANNAQTTANNAQTTANNAQTTANNAQTTANSKMNSNNPVGTGSFSMGRKTGSVVGTKSHTEGSNTTASGNASHAEGAVTTASGYCSHAEGSHTTASGFNSHAEGDGATASGDRSHAEGLSTTASSQDQHAQGKYNVVDSQHKYAHIVGNGTNNSARSNAHTLDWNGVPWFKGRPQFGGTAQDQGSQTVVANGDKELILKSSTTNSTKKFKITVDDDYNVSATNTSDSVSKTLATTEYVDSSVSKSNPLNITGATVGQIAKITAVDSNGKPTAWQAVDMPSGGGDVWEFGGTIPLDLTTPTAVYEFAPCSIWKKVRIVRVRPSYNKALSSYVWYGASNCENKDGSIGNFHVLYTSNGYVYHCIEMMTDDDGGIVGTSAESNHAGAPVGLSSSAYLNNRVASNIPPTYNARSLTKDSNWMVQAHDSSAAWDGNETYYWWGVRA